MLLEFKCKVWFFTSNLYSWAFDLKSEFFNFRISAIPEDAINEDSEDEDKSNPDERISIRASDKRIAPENEYSDSEDEGDRRDERYDVAL